MLITYLRAVLRNKHYSNVYRYALVVMMSLYTLPVFAQAADSTTDVNAVPGSQISSVSAQTMLENIATQIPNLMELVTAIAYVLGMTLIFSGIVKMKHFGEMRTQMSQEHGIMGPIMYLAIGTMLLYLPTSVQVGMSTFWLSPNPYGYTEQTDQWSEFLNVCFLIIQFLGTVAFIRGLLILSHMSGSHGGQSPLAKGLTHIIGGIFCINIYQFVQVVLNTLGIQVT